MQGVKFQCADSNLNKGYFLKMSKQTGNLIKLQIYGTRSSNVVGSMYYWLVSWPQHRAKAIKSRMGGGHQGMQPKVEPAKECKSKKRGQEQKKGRCKQSAGANVKTQTGAKLATWKLRPMQPTLGCHQELSCNGHLYHLH